jgi:hypothetical protein
MYGLEGKLRNQLTNTTKIYIHSFLYFLQNLLEVTPFFSGDKLVFLCLAEL